MLLRGFRRGYPEERTSGQNTETNFFFLHHNLIKGFPNIYTCMCSFIHLTSFNVALCVPGSARPWEYKNKHNIFSVFRTPILMEEVETNNQST